MQISLLSIIHFYLHLIQLPQMAKSNSSEDLNFLSGKPNEEFYSSDCGIASDTLECVPSQC